MRYIFLFCLFFSSNLWADYSTHPMAKIFIANAPQMGLDKEKVKNSFKKVSKDEIVLGKISKPAEKTKPWFEYEKIFLTEDRIKAAQNFYQENYQFLKETEKKFGVDSRVIVAILAVETRFGKFVGKDKVLQSLSTLCFDYPPRADFFCEELGYFFTLSKKQGWIEDEIIGSYAGAMGMAQFMPSSYSKDAIDCDNDGKIDLWNSKKDAICSVANYLHKRGWIFGTPIYLELSAIPEVKDFGKTHREHLKISELKNDHLLKNEPNFLEITDNLSPQTEVGSLILQGKTGKLAFICFNNFVVITKYNTSPMYALAVSKLVETINQSE